jgi:hypothetical protein
VKRLRDVGHLARRFAGALSPRPPSANDERWAIGWLAEPERALWIRMSNSDRRHAIAVARRFVVRMPTATTAQIAAALMHDVGKVAVDLGTFQRVMATIVGPRGRRFRAYHAHEQIGMEMLRDAGSSVAVLAVLSGDDASAAEALRRADDL